MHAMTPEIQKMCDFFDEIGIKWAICTLSDEDSTFLPGIKIVQGTLQFDLAKLKYPGDLLHEAGHIAVEAPESRTLMNNNADFGKTPEASLEPAAILWSYAALRHLKLPIEFVFHDDGYKGIASWFRMELSNGRYMGLPLLQWMDLCVEPKIADQTGQLPFPHMLKWLR